MTTKYRPMRMRLTKTEKLQWDKVWSSIDVDADMNENESSGTENPVSLVYNQKYLLTALNHASYTESINLNLFDDTSKADFEITYDFSSAIRNNVFVNVNGKRVKYGADGWSFRTLYEYLCATYGGGTYFIDTYFERFFPVSWAQHEYFELKMLVQHSVWQDIWNMRKAWDLSRRRTLREFVAAAVGADPKKYRYRDERGRFISGINYTTAPMERDLRAALAGGGWAKLLSHRRHEIEDKMRYLSDSIREDIIMHLRRGELTRKAADKTLTKRLKLGMYDSNALFYASGQLIKDMKLYIQLDSGGWKKGKSAPRMGYTGYHGGRVVGGNI